MPFRIGLSGLNAAQADLKITGNNIANVSTIGFKQSRAEFADVYASSKFGSVGTAIGSGVRLAAAAQQFTQGNIIFTENNLDLGVTGEGFFALDDTSGNRVYSRNGQFKVDKNGVIVDNSGSSLKGYGIDAVTNNINTGSIVDLQIISTNIAPNATTESSLVANIDSGEAVPSLPFTMNSQGTVDPQGYNHTTSFTSFDSLGNPMLTSMFYRKTTAGEWDVGIKQVDINGNIFQNMDPLAVQAGSATEPQVLFIGSAGSLAGAATAGAGEINTAAFGVSANVADSATISGAYNTAYLTGGHSAGMTAAAASAATFEVTYPGITAAVNAASAAASAAAATATPRPMDTIVFNNNGTIDPNAAGGTITNGILSFTVPLSDASLSNPVMTTGGGALQTQPIDIDLNGLTQYGANFGVTNLTQDGYTTGQLSGIDVDQSGVISARFTNGQSNNLGQVFLANFTNTQGLSQLGDNYWGESFSSGQAIINAPGDGNAGLINSGALEDSNVDLTAQLINLITAQRNFQANAKTITTADTITQTVIQL